MAVSHTGDKAAVDSLQQLLGSAKTDVEMQRTTVNKQNKEIDRLRRRIDELQVNLEFCQCFQVHSVFFFYRQNYPKNVQMLLDLKPFLRSIMFKYRNYSVV